MRKLFRGVGTFVAVAALVASSAMPARAMAPDWLELISANDSGVAAGVSPFSHGSSMSANGRYVSFISSNPNGLLSGQQGSTGLYLRDRQLGTTTLVSVGNNGQQANRLSNGNIDQDLSSNGELVMFMSASDNIDPMATDGEPHCYIRDLNTGITQTASITPSGSVSTTRFCDISDDGNVVAFVPLAQTASPVYIRNLQTNTTTQLPYLASVEPLALSGDGRYLAFNKDSNVQVYDNISGTTTLASVNTIGGSNDGYMNTNVDNLSVDGRYVFFQSSQKLTSDAPSPCGSCVFTYRRDLLGGTTMYLHSYLAIGLFSRDGNINVNNFQSNIIKRDLTTNTTQTIVPAETWGGVAGGGGPLSLNANGTLMTLVTRAFEPYPQAYVATTQNHSPDSTPPTVGQPSWSTNPVQQGQDTTLSVTASDDSGAVAQVQYSVEGGQPQPMTYNSTLGVWQATFGSSLTANSYNIDITASDTAGNSATVNDILAVYNPTNGYVTGHAKVTPTASDSLPIALDTSNNPAKLVAGFTNVTSPANGSFDVNYIVKNNKDEFTLSSTLINWVVVPDSTHASILGRANLSTFVNGSQTITQNVSVRFDITLGVGGAPDHLTVKIFSPNDNPNTASPLYQISQDVIASGSNLMIHQ
jgi:hypothetical protein